MRGRLIVAASMLGAAAVVTAGAAPAFAQDVTGVVAVSGAQAGGGGFPWDAVLGFGIAGAAAMAIVAVVARERLPRGRQAPRLLIEGRPPARAFEPPG